MATLVEAYRRLNRTNVGGVLRIVDNFRFFERLLGVDRVFFA